ncbi:hypothetical protein [Actinomadura opuntiae]|uniref:hypothetical protein n=1 Tax=Actinomadura sp. OS1-43 TaxID=604315 RepID=UPI00255B0482|nr:hypothetical protein [Actinomadura sp. OS1-43]MDL4818551.1 hypothetical protein [Actinomadura sp. OS1-43]
MTPAGAPDLGSLADAVAAAVVACPEVARLATGPEATYLPGRVVHGVSVDGPCVRVAVIVRYGRPLAGIAERVRAAAEGAAPGRRVEVAIDDIDLPEG